MINQEIILATFLSTPVSYSSTAPPPLIQSHPPSSSPSYPSNSSSNSSHAHSRNPAGPDRHFAHNTSQSSKPCPRCNRHHCCSRLKERTTFLARRSQSRRRCGSRRSFRHRPSLGCRIRSLDMVGQSSRRWRRSLMGTVKVLSLPSLFGFGRGGGWMNSSMGLTRARRWVGKG